jgi:cytochrome P450
MGETTTDAPIDWNPLRPLDDPYPLYRRMRDAGPLYHDAARGIWAFTRFDDVQAASRDWETFSSQAGGTGNDHDDTYQLFLPAGDIAATDPPLHTRLRGALRLAFSPSRIQAQFEADVRATATELIGRFAGEGRADLALGFARPLPALVMFTWLGFPAADHPRLLELFTRMLDRVPGERALPGTALSARDQMREYVGAAADQRRRAPTDDLMGFLVRAEQSAEISRDELVGATMLLFIAGIVTTSGLISNSLLHLDRFPDQQELVRREPDRLPVAIEELLRFDAPIQTLGRTATRDVLDYGTVIPAGAPVSLVWASANRDERRWPDPDRLDLTRAPQRHVAFGEGIHHCLGAPLARLEARIAFEEFFRRIPAYAVVGPVERISTPTDRGLEHLPVEL